MQVEFVLDVEDCIAWYWWHVRTDPKARRRERAFLVAVVLLEVCLALAVLTDLVEGRQRLPFDSNTLFVLLLMALLAGLYLMRHRLESRRIRRGIRSNESAQRLPVHCRLTIEPAALSVATDLSTTRYLWQAVQRIVTVQDHAFFCLTQQGAICLPRRAFSDEKEFTEFVETAHRYHEASGQV